MTTSSLRETEQKVGEKRVQLQNQKDDEVTGNKIYSKSVHLDHY
jgi:hypothetical protein